MAVRKFVIIILLQKEMRVATCDDMQAHMFFAFSHKNARRSHLSCSWFVSYIHSYYVRMFALLATYIAQSVNYTFMSFIFNGQMCFHEETMYPFTRIIHMYLVWNDWT